MPQRLRKDIIKAAAIFILSYFVILSIWIYVKELYGTVLLNIISRVVGFLTNAAYVDIYREADMFTVVFGSLKIGERAVPMSIDSFTYNVPAALAISAALMPFIRRKLRGFVESLTFLFFVHVLYVLMLEALSFTMGHDVLHAVNEYLFLFMHKLMTRSEPFIIGIYLFTVHVETEKQ